MRVIARSCLVEFWAKHPAAKTPLQNWYAEVKAAEWKSPADVKKTYANSSVLQRGRVVFNIGGNKYRLVVSIAYKTQIVFIKFVGTHQQYDRIDAQNVEYKP